MKDWWFDRRKRVAVSSNGVLFRSILLVILLSVFFCKGMQAKGNSNPVLDFAKQQIAQKSYAAAISTINNLLSQDPKNVDGLYWKAYCFYKLENYLAAEQNYYALLKLDTKYEPAYEDLGEMYKKQKKFDLAITYFSSAIALRDSNVNLYNNRGLCYYYFDKFELAIKDFKRALKLDSLNYFAYNNLGVAKYNNQNIASASIMDLRSAEVDFNKAIQLKPDFELAYRNRGIVRYYMDSLGTAYKDLLYATQLDPKDDNAHYYIGKLLFKQNNYTIAMQFYDNAIKLVNYKHEMYTDRGLCKMEMGNYKGALSDFYQAVLLTNERGIPYYNSARAYAAQDDKKNTMQALREAKKAGLFEDVKYFTYISKDKYFSKYTKDADFLALIQELKFGKK